MTLHPPKRPSWSKPVLREERRQPARPARKTTGFTLGSLLGDAVRAEQAKKDRRAELDAAGFSALGGA